MSAVIVTAPMQPSEPSLSDVLARLGWRHEPGNPNRQGRIVHTADGECLGQITANETWALLRERGLVTTTEVA